jgi:FdhE protein
MTAAAALNGLKQRRPEWGPWLGVVEAVVRNTDAPAWLDAVPDPEVTRREAAPLLAGAVLAIDPRMLRSLQEQLIRRASRSGSAKLATLHAAAFSNLDPLALFTASLCHDAVRIQEIAASIGADAEALQGVVALLPMPFLHACNRKWSSSIWEGWIKGYCPICSSWPAFAEVRGIERSRHFRCGRCSAHWHARALCCPYCSNNDHDELVSLVPEKSGAQATIDACTRCRRYVKTFTRLQGCPDGTIMLEDLATVDLDIAAIEQDYSRPAGAGYPLEVTVTAADAARRRSGWGRERH